MPNEGQKKNTGVTEAERHLNALAQRSFLTMWSHPGLFKSAGDELCDLLVICGDDIVIFSSKDCIFPDSGDIGKDWSRWFKNAVADSAKQLWGAERHLRARPDQLFQDASAKKPFHLALPEPENARFHLVSVSHQASGMCRKYHGGSGSLMIRSDVRGMPNHILPFTIGDLDPEKSFVHVLDDTSLDFLMKNLDTITDFVNYLSKREIIMRAEDVQLMSAGEEEMLASYLKNLNPEEEHDFEIPHRGEGSIGVFYSEGLWATFEKNPQRIAQQKEDRISYFWDHLIETFTKYAQEGSQYFPQHGGIKVTEKILRFMAKEPRFMRRVLSKQLLDALEKTPKDKRLLRCTPPFQDEGPHYVFLIFPWRKDKSEEENRLARFGFLECAMRVFKAKYPETKDIVGIATETGRHEVEGGWGSEDAAYLDGREWTEENQKEALSLQKELGILVSPEQFKVCATEYPDISPIQEESTLSKNPRNKPCPCGSNIKYKKCHGK